MTVAEQAVWNKVLSYPLANWDIEHTPCHPRGSAAYTSLTTINPSGNEVIVTHITSYSTTYDWNDRATTHESYRYEVKVDGQYLSDLGQDFMRSLYDTLKGRVESSPDYHQRLANEAKAREAAKDKALRDLHSKL